MSAFRIGRSYFQRDLSNKFNYTAAAAISAWKQELPSAAFCQKSIFLNSLSNNNLTAVNSASSRINQPRKSIISNHNQQQQQQAYKMPEGQKPQIIFVLGGPGAGKGTQCSKIVERYQFVHLSAGDLLREERAREGSEYGKLIEDYIREGKIVPVEVTCSLLENAMQASGKQRFLIDGFPRNQDNLDGWSRQMADKVEFKFVLFFNCSEDKCVERCLSRGQSGSGRTDDNLESLKKRIQTYNNDSLPIIKHFERLGQVKQIDASPNADQVFKSVEQIFAAAGY